MAVPESPATGPKPFVFVLMPFGKEFNDTYTFGIKGAAEDIGAYAERVDEQMFEDGILDRIFNQINKADVIVADMTGRNPNVFYEVGYAHALNKIVVLLTQSADDIPFDLKHRQHIVYSGEIGTLKARLIERLTWAIAESKRRGWGTSSLQLAVSCSGVDLPELSVARAIPKVVRRRKVEVLRFPNRFQLSLDIRNIGSEITNQISHVYVFTAKEPIEPVKTERRELLGDLPEPLRVLKSIVDLKRFHATEADKSKIGLEWQYRLPVELPAIPPGGVESLSVSFKRTGPQNEARLSFRFHTGGIYLDYLFDLVAEEE